MGIDVNRTIAITFVIAGALAGAAGLVQILYNNTTVWNLGFRFGLNAFTSAVLGGIGNLQGAVLGGIVLGLINAFSDRYLSASMDERDRLRRAHRRPGVPPDRPPRPAAGGPGMSGNLVTPVRVEKTGGLPAWLRYMGAAVTSWPPSYRAAYAKIGAARSC